MKAIIGSAIGVLALGLVLVGAGLRGAASTAAGAVTSFGAGPAAIPVADVATARTASGAVTVTCSPGQRAIVRPMSLNGETVSQVACVDDASALAGTSDLAGAMPVAQRVSFAPVRRTALAERRVVYQEPAPARVASRSSWKKPLLVIGGSTAAGAGIGGLIGGGKGALIGAALGGGASTLFEATRK